MMERCTFKTMGVCLALTFVFMARDVTAREDAAPDQTIEGVVVRVADGEVIVDLGHSEGLPAHAEVQILRRVEVTHPVTEETVVDRFPIGTINLTQVGDQLSIATKVDALDRLPSVGDYVVWSKAADASAAPPVGRPQGDARPAEASADCDCEEVSTRSPALEAVDETFAETLGQLLGERIATWSEFLEEHPDSPYADAIGGEIEWLRSRLEEQRRAAEQHQEAAQDPSSTSVQGDVSAPGRVEPGQPVDLVATFDKPERVEQVRVLVRRPDQPGFDERAMERAGDANWRVRLDDLAESPGALEYFVEAVDADSELELVAGSASAPLELRVEPTTVDPEQTRDRSRATGLFEYVNFKSGAGDDEYLRFESDYRYRVDQGFLDAFKVGVGIFDGKGGTVEEIETGGRARELSVSYGFAELQFGLGDLVGLSGRLLVGDRKSPTSSGLDGTFGFRSGLRVGRRDATRLELGYAHTDGIGNEVWIELAVAEIDNMPMSGEVVVTNLPVGEDLGVMLNYGTGYQFTDWFTLMARVGWNARTINYQGPTVGLATVIDW